LAPVTVLSADTTTWLLTGSVAQAVPGIRAERSSVAVARNSRAPLCRTSRAAPPAARTRPAAARSVTVTIIVPVRSR
jgi:hypothetical protein